MLAGMFGASGSGASPNTDTFDVDSLSDYTEYANSAGNWSIGGGVCTVSTGSQAIITREGVVMGDGTARLAMTNAYDGGLGFRLQDNNNYYVAVVTDSTNSAQNQKLQMYKRVSGSYTLLGSIQSISFVAGTPHVLEVVCSGSSIVVKWDGATIISQTDSTFSSGRVGPRMGDAGACSYDSFTWP